MRRVRGSRNFSIRIRLIRIRFSGRVAIAIEIFLGKVRLKISRGVLPADACLCPARDLLMAVVLALKYIRPESTRYVRSSLPAGSQPDPRDYRLPRQSRFPESKASFLYDPQEQKCLTRIGVNGGCGMSVSGNCAIPGIVVLVVIFCAVAGCSGVLPANPAAAGGSTSGSSSGGSGGGSGGGSSSSGYPQYAYFTFACTGSWTESSDHHGTFSMTGTMPFTLDYPWDNGAGIALYTSDTGKNNGGTPLRVKSEVWDGGLTTESDSQPCHFTWEGDVGAAGSMNYQNRKWTVYFLPVALDTETYRTISVRQDSPDCPAEYNSPEFVHPDLYQPEYDCIVSDEPVPFDFSTGSGFDLPPHTPGKSWNTFASHISFSRGKAPG